MPAKRDARGRFVSNGKISGKSNSRSNGKSNGSRIDEKKLAFNRELVLMAATSRQELLRKLFDPRRDINDECGYPVTANITSVMYRELYDREPIAARVVEVLPEESWAVDPQVFEDQSEDTTTDFEAAWATLGDQLRGEQSWFHGEADQKGHPIWEVLERADVLSGIGRYGVILLGLDDGKKLSEPVEPQDNLSLLYLRCFDESLASISRYDSEPTSPRFGMPEEYSLSFANPNSGISAGTLATVKVHWSRVVHVADNIATSEILGTPRMQPVYNRLYDLRKLYSGSAEMYWRGAFPGVSFSLHPQLIDSAEIDEAKRDAFREQMESYMNSLQRYLFLEGVEAKSLAPQVSDPSKQIDKQIEAICVRLAIPKRIFTGSERGELASSQDSKTWNRRMARRQSRYLTPRVIVPFVDRLIALRVLPEPSQYVVRWPSLDVTTPEETAVVAERRTNALAKYVGGGVDNLIDPLSYLTKVLDFSKEEAMAILEDTAAFLEDQLNSQE